MKVRIIEGCIGCGTCWSLCPGVFAEDGGFACVKAPVPAPDDELQVSEAADSCPVSVIIIE